MTKTMLRNFAIVLALGAASAWAAQTADAPEKIPPVVLSKQHEALCKVQVGDIMPAIELPQLRENGAARLSDLFGEKATVVVFWSTDRRMSRAQLADLTPDVIEPFAEMGVAVVGIAVRESASSAEEALQQARASFPNLLDAEGRAFAAVGRDRLPRTYLLDPQGKILWFDIEYSHATRRELQQALRALVGEPASAGG
jgi:peroxiredoxin